MLWVLVWIEFGYLAMIFLDFWNLSNFLDLIEPLIKAIRILIVEIIRKNMNMNFMNDRDQILFNVGKEKIKL